MDSPLGDVQNNSVYDYIKHHANSLAKQPAPSFLLFDVGIPSLTVLEIYVAAHHFQLQCMKFPNMIIVASNSHLRYINSSDGYGMQIVLNSGMNYVARPTNYTIGKNGIQLSPTFLNLDNKENVSIEPTTYIFLPFPTANKVHVISSDWHEQTMKSINKMFENSIEEEMFIGDKSTEISILFDCMILTGSMDRTFAHCSSPSTFFHKLTAGSLSSNQLNEIEAKKYNEIIAVFPKEFLPLFIHWLTQSSVKTKISIINDLVNEMDTIVKNWAFYYASTYIRIQSADSNFMGDYHLKNLDSFDIHLYKLQYPQQSVQGRQQSVQDPQQSLQEESNPCDQPSTSYEPGASIRKLPLKPIPCRMSSRKDDSQLRKCKKRMRYLQKLPPQ